MFVKAVRQKRSELRRSRKHDIVVRDVVAHIASGDLQPGDRLAPVNDLVEHYGVSHRAVLHALRILAERGVIVKRQRSGCFIAPSAISGPAPVVVNGNSTAASLSAQFSAYLSPYLKKRTLIVYVSELFDVNLAIWRRFFDDFCAMHPNMSIEMLSCHDGHLEEICREHAPDIALATPEVLAHLGADRFLNLDLDACGLSIETPVPPVAEYLHRTPRAIGVPYLLTLNYVYANVELAEQAGIAGKPPASFAELMQRSAAIAEKFGPEKLGHAATGLLLDELFATGSVKIGEAGELLFDAERCRSAFEALVASKFQPVPCLEVIPAFISGRLAHLWHCSFTAVELAQTAAFRWVAMPLPVAYDARMPGYLMVLAISAATGQRDACLALLRHLLSLPAQKQLAAMGGNMPVSNDAIFSPDVLAQHRVPEETLRQALAYTTIVGADAARNTLMAAMAKFTPAPIAWALYQGKISPAEAAGHLRAILERG